MYATLHYDDEQGLFCIAPFEHALNIDFVNEALGPGARVGGAERGGRALVEAIDAVLERAEAGGYPEQPAQTVQDT